MKRLIFLLWLIPWLCFGDAGIVGDIANLSSQSSVTYEDFTGYTETDPGSTITVDSSTKVSWSDFETRLAGRYVYIDKTVDHFNGDFVHQLEITTTSGSTSYYQPTPWMVGTEINDADEMADGLYLQINGSAQFRWQLGVVENTADTTANSTSNTAVEGTKYYVTMTLDWDGGVNSTGQIKAEIRLTSHTTEAGKVTLTVDRSVGEQNSYQYLYALASYNTASSGNLHTGSTENLNINE